MAIISKVANNEGVIASVNSGVVFNNRIGAGKTAITLSETIIFSKYEKMGNPENALKRKEVLHVGLQVEYKFYNDEIREYNSNSKMSTDVHSPRWFLLDKSGSYQPVHISKNTNGIIKETLFFKISKECTQKTNLCIHWN